MHFNVDANLDTASLAAYAVNQLLAGPTVGGDSFVSFPQGTQATVTLEGSLAAVDLHGRLSQSFQSGGTDEAAMFKSLTYTLTALPGVHSVQVLVDGKKVAALPGGAFELDEPLTRETFSQ